MRTYRGALFKTYKVSFAAGDDDARERIGSLGAGEPREAAKRDARRLQKRGENQEPLQGR